MEQQQNECYALPSEPAIDPNDPLSTDIADMDFSFPTVSHGTVTIMRVKEAKVENSKDNTGQNLVVTFENVNELTSLPRRLPGGTTGVQQLPPGRLPMKHYVGLTPKPADPTTTPPKKEYTIVDVGANLGKLLDNLGYGRGTSPRMLINNPMMIAGKCVTVQLELTKPTIDFPTPSNRIKSFKKLV